LLSSKKRKRGYGRKNRIPSIGASAILLCLKGEAAKGSRIFLKGGGKGGEPLGGFRGIEFGVSPFAISGVPSFAEMKG